MIAREPQDRKKIAGDPKGHQVVRLSYYCNRLG